MTDTPDVAALMDAHVEGQCTCSFGGRPDPACHQLQSELRDGRRRALRAVEVRMRERTEIVVWETMMKIHERNGIECGTVAQGDVRAAIRALPLETESADD